MYKSWQILFGSENIFLEAKQRNYAKDNVDIWIYYMKKIDDTLVTVHHTYWSYVLLFVLFSELAHGILWRF